MDRGEEADPRDNVEHGLSSLGRGEEGTDAEHVNSVSLSAARWREKYMFCFHSYRPLLSATSGVGLQYCDVLHRIAQ